MPTTYRLAPADGNPGSPSNRSFQVSSASNHTRQQGGGGVPVIGLPGPLFTVIHVSALVTLSVSTVVTLLLLVCRCCCRGSVRSHTRSMLNQETIITRVLAKLSTARGKSFEEGGGTVRGKSGGGAEGGRRVEEGGEGEEPPADGKGRRIEAEQIVGGVRGEGRTIGIKRVTRGGGKGRPKTVRDRGGIEGEKLGRTEDEEIANKSRAEESTERADEEIGSGENENEREGEVGNEEGRRASDQQHKSKCNQYSSTAKKISISFWNWSTGERFVIYLGVCDLCHGVSHFLDHAYMLHTKDHPPEVLCAIFAFFLHEFTFAQWFVILATAISACSLVVFGRKISFGRFDWRLIAFAFGVPALLGAIALSLGLLGPSGAWCYINMGSASGQIYSELVSLVQICSFGLIGVAYGSIWIKIRRTTKLMKGSTTERYQSSAKVMMVFVAAFILQWWSLVLFNVWMLVATPPSAVLVLSVVVINLGGVYNCIAYTVIRRRLQRQRMKKPKNGAVVMETHQRVASSRCGLKVSNEITLTPDNACVSQSVSDDPGKALHDSICSLQNIPSYTEIYI